MALRAVVPLVTVLTAEDGEVLSIMIKAGGFPRSLGVTAFAGQGVPVASMVRVRCRIVIREVAACIGAVPDLSGRLPGVVTGLTIHIDMSTLQEESCIGFRMLEFGR